MPPILVEAKNVNKSYNGIPVLKNINFEVEDIEKRGQIVTLLGPSGIGKSTLFRITAGLESADSGYIGKDGKQFVVGQVGVVYQDYKFYRHRTVKSNLILAAKASGMSNKEIPDAVKSIINKFKLTGKEDSYWKYLSGGQRQRVAIAQQILNGDDVLLMDEPFSGLDIVVQNEVIDLINDVACNCDAKTIIIVTHDIPAGIRVADTVWMLGRDYDGENPIPGSYIKHCYKNFTAKEEEIRERFLQL